MSASLLALTLALVVKSAAFAPSAPIPEVHTCDGKDQSPPLEIADLPATAVTWALIVDDPDAPSGTFVHWVAWNLDPRFRTLAPGLPRDTLTLPGGAQQGRNHFRKLGYYGPCPPPGKPHHYRFRVFALDTRLTFTTPTATAADLEQAMRGHVVASGTLVGTYRR